MNKPRYLNRRFGLERQRGSVLVELGLYLLIASMILMAQFYQSLAAIDKANGVATGQFLTQVQAGVNQCLINNWTGYSAATINVPALPNPLAPTIADLQTAKCLPLNFIAVGTNQTPIGKAIAIKLSRTGTCPGTTCSIVGLAYTTSSLVDSDGVVMRPVLSNAVEAIGVDGAQSFPPGTTVSAAGGIWNQPNPVPGQDGILAIRLGSASGLMGLLDGFYLLDGSRPLTGQMNANGNNIININDIKSTGNTTLNNLQVNGDAILAGTATPGTACNQQKAIKTNSSLAGLVVCDGSTWQIVGNAVPGIGDGVPCVGTPVNQIGTSATGVAYICNGQFWSAIQNFASAGDPCPIPGQTASSVTSREQLFCKSGIYMRMKSLLAGTVEINRFTVKDGDRVPKAVCDAGGTPSREVVITQTVVDVSVIPPRQAFYATASDGGSDWVAEIRLKDNFGGNFSGNSYGLTATLINKCSY